MLFMPDEISILGFKNDLDTEGEGKNFKRFLIFLCSKQWNDRWENSGHIYAYEFLTWNIIKGCF